MRGERRAQAELREPLSWLVIYLRPKILFKKDLLRVGVGAGAVGGGSTRAACALGATEPTAGATFFLATAFLAAAGFFFSVAMLFLPC